MNAFFERIAPQVSACGIIPVFCPKNEAELDTFLKAVVPSPLKVVEITLRSRFAAEAVARIKREAPSLLVGAGTILSHELLDTAADAGADFLVSPGFSPALLSRAKELSPSCPAWLRPPKSRTPFWTASPRSNSSPPSARAESPR